MDTFPKLACQTQEKMTEVTSGFIDAMRVQ